MGYRLSPTTMASAILLPPPYTGSYPIGELEDIPAAPPGPQVTVDAVGPSSAGAGGAVSSTSWSHTVGAGATLLLIGVVQGAGGSTTATVTYGGVSASLLAKAQSGASTEGSAQLFALANPTPGTATVAVTGGAGTTALECGSVSLLNSDTLPAAVTSNGTTGAPTITLGSTPTGSLVVDVVCNGGPITAPSAGQTLEWLRNVNNASAGGNGAMSVETGGSSVTMSWTTTADWWGQVAVAVPALAGGATLNGAVNLTQATTLTTDGTLEAFGAVDLTATATLTVTPPPIAGAVSLTTSQTLSVAGAVSQPGSTTLTATTALSVGAPVLGAAAAVSLVSVKTLSIASPALTAVAAVSLIGSGGLSVAGIRTTDGVVVLTATPALSTIALLNEFAAVSLTAAGTLSVTGRLGAFGAVSLPAVGVLTVTVGGVGGAVALTTAQSLSAGAALIEVATVSLSAVSALSTSGIRTTAGLVTLSAVPVLTAGVTVGITNGSATLTALSSLTAGGIRITSAAVVPLVAAGVLSVNGSTGSGGGASLAATTALVVAGVTVRIGTTQLTVLPSLVVSGIAVEFAALTLTATGVLSVNGARVGVGSVSLVSVGLLLANVVIRLAGSVSLVALPNLVFIEIFPTIDIFAAGDWTIGGVGLHRDRPPYERAKSGWTTAGIHVGSVRS